MTHNRRAHGLPVVVQDVGWGAGMRGVTECDAMRTTSCTCHRSHLLGEPNIHKVYDL
jgi:hypothetical protein